MAGPEGPTVLRGPAWFFAHLTRADERSYCRVNLAHTILLDKKGTPSRWLYTDESGRVVRRAAVEVGPMLDVLRRSLSDASNVERLCAVLRYEDLSEEVLSSGELEEQVADTLERRGSLQGVVALSGYIHPRGGDGTVFRHTWLAPEARDGSLRLHWSGDPRAPSRTERWPRALVHGGSRGEGVGLTHDPDVARKLDAMAANVAEFLEDQSAQRVARVTLEFVFDSANRPWLLWPRGVETYDPLGKDVSAAKAEALASGKGRSGAGGGGGGGEEDDLGIGVVGKKEGYLRGDGGGGGGGGGGSMGSLPSLPGSPMSSARKIDEDTMGRARADEARLAAEAAAAEAARQLETLSRNPRGVGDGWRGRVLLCDDDGASVVAAVQALQEQGYLIRVVTDGSAALAATRHDPWDALLIGTSLPSLSGTETTRLLRQREAGLAGAAADGAAQRLPVIAFTGETAPEHLREYMESGMDGCVCKPVDTTALVQTMAAAIPLPEGGEPDEWEEGKHSYVTGGPSVTSLSSTASGRERGGAGRGGGGGGGGESAVVDRARREISSTIRPGKGGLGGAPLSPVRGSKTVGGAGGGGRRGKRASGRLPALPDGGEGPPPTTSAIPTAASEDDETHGVFQLDAETAIPYTIIGKARPGAPLFHFVVCQDIFDTSETYQIFFRPICAKYPGLRVLTFNYPGQAFTEWRRDAVLSNEYLAGILEALLSHLGAAGTGEFDLDDGEAPFHLLGYGLGGAVASFFATRYQGAHPNLRSLLLVNGATHVDAHLAGVLHDCMNVFACAPPSRPDLPVYFFSRFLFSPAYLTRVGAPLALNLYTAVHNPISLEGRVQLCQGLLASVDTRDALEVLDLPVVAVAASRDAFIRVGQVQALVHARGGEERSLRKALKSRKRVCVVWLRAGHEVWQEARRPVTHLLEQLATGYHERNDVSFLPLAADGGAEGLDGPAGAAARSAAMRQSRSEKLAASASDRARARAAALAGTASSIRGGGGEGEPTLSPGQTPGQPRLFEDRYVESVLDATRRSGPPQSSSSSHHGATGRSGMSRGGSVTFGETHGTMASDPMGSTGDPFGETQEGDAPDALHFSPPAPPGLKKPLGSTGMSSTYRTSKIGMVDHDGDADTLSKEEAARRANKRREEAKRMHLLMNLDPESVAFDSRDRAVEKEGPGGAQHSAEVKEYMSWRVRRNRKRLQRIEACAVQIQRCWRAYLARTLVARMRQQRAALAMQRWWRGCLGRKHAAERRRELWAARVVQRYWRGHKGRAVAWRLRAEELSARTIQRSWRGWRARRFVEMIRNARHEAATRIQAAWRRRRAMREAWRLRDMHNAAVNVQRVFRGHLGRQRARRERDRYLFSRSQAQGIEFGRQMLLEHKLQGTRLQSEVALLTKEKLEAEEAVESVLAEIATFEAGVRALEKEMLELSRAEAEAAGTLDEEAKAELRENKLRLDREFGEMLVRIADRREKLQALERKLQSLDRARQAKKEELADLERKLVVLLEEQQRELAAIKARQARKGEGLIEDAVTAVTSAFKGGSAGAPRLGHGSAGGGGGELVPYKKGAGGGEMRTVVRSDGTTAIVPVEEMGGGGGGGGPTPQQRAEANALLASAETMMKFGFMSMSLTYFSSLNMVRAMRRVGAANTVLANPLLAGQLAGSASGGAGAAGAVMGSMGALMGASPAQLGATGSSFRPTGTSGAPTDVSLWTVADVSSWLETLSLGQYKDAFADAAVDGAFLHDLTDDDLRNTLGIEHALHRKKILGAIRRLRESEERIASGVSGGPATGGGGGGGGVAPAGGGGTVSGGPSTTLSGGPSTSTLPDGGGSGGGGGGGDPASTGGLKLLDLMTFVRHSKGRKLADALRPLPDAPFDRSKVRAQFVPGYGTQFDSLTTTGFDINDVDEHGNSLLHVAAQNGNLRIAQLLVRKGAYVDHQNHVGQTALHYALAYDYMELAEWLASPDGGGADDTILNSEGLSAYDGLSAEG